MKKVAKATLHFHRPGHDGNQPSDMSGRLPSESWITEDLLLETQKVWSGMYGRVISAGEALEILRSVKSLAEVMWNIVHKRMTP